MAADGGVTASGRVLAAACGSLDDPAAPAAGPTFGHTVRSAGVPLPLRKGRAAEAPDVLWYLTFGLPERAKVRKLLIRPADGPVSEPAEWRLR